MALGAEGKQLPSDLMLMGDPVWIDERMAKNKKKIWNYFKDHHSPDDDPSEGYLLIRRRLEKAGVTFYPDIHKDLHFVLVYKLQDDSFKRQHLKDLNKAIQRLFEHGISDVIINKFVNERSYGTAGFRTKWMLTDGHRISDSDEEEARKYIDEILSFSDEEYKYSCLKAYVTWIGFSSFPSRSDFNRVYIELERIKEKKRRAEEERKRAVEMMKEYDRLGEKAKQLLDGILNGKDDSKKYQALRNWLTGFGKTLFPFPVDYERAKEAFVEVERRIKEAENQRKQDLEKARNLLGEFREYCGSAGTRLDQFLNGNRFRRDGKPDKNDIPPIVDRNLNVSSDLPIDSVEFKILFELGNPIQGFQVVLKEAFVMQMREAGSLLSPDDLFELKSLRKTVHTQFLLFLKSEGVRMPIECERFVRKFEEDKK